jgi:hypothetical protein
VHESMSHAKLNDVTGHVHGFGVTRDTWQLLYESFGRASYFDVPKGMTRPNTIQRQHDKMAELKINFL